ncbi:ABC transporter ATP-binding protein [Candidatus Peregrinibacteria bacterium]|jgi:ABC-2 type transport system ATP-binding protein|nr:ABC transporter ATP-binding protein [Candidatus Peregrinibacteria bacterium]
MIKISKLSKNYEKEKKEALKNVSFQVAKNEFIALLGPNGAGKSTLINILSGNTYKSSGAVSVGKYDLETQELETKKMLGVVPQEITFDSFFTVNEVLNLQSGYFGIANNQKYIDELLKDLSLSDKKDANTRALSGGMKRRLLIAKALVHKPKILILDEPTAGVDIELRQQLYVFLKKLHAQGVTIILTTHYLEEAEELCDRVIIINKGEIIADDTKDSLVRSFGNKVVIELAFENKILEKDFKFLSEFEPKVENKQLFLKASRDKLNTVFGKLSEKNMQYQDINIQKQDLEEVFLKLVKQV